MEIKIDCRHFKGDRPCTFHKEKGVTCDACYSYDQLTERILIIKLDAIGDVLRTTSILPALKKQSPHAQITWITEKESLPLFINNPYVDRVYSTEEAAVVLQTDTFNRIINMDASLKSARLLLMAMGGIKIGFMYNPSIGSVIPINSEAQEWFEMGLNDILKRENKKTYQQIILEICKLPTDVVYEPVLLLTEEEIQTAYDGFGTDTHKVIGINVGGGTRWKNKQWGITQYIDLIDRLAHAGFKTLLLGGKAEEDLMRVIQRNVPFYVINVGSNNSLREFASYINLCNLIITGDTLGLHIATALKKKVILLVGPTSPTELELYYRGEKVVSDLPCVGCYKQTCTVSPNCMESITVDMVLNAVKRNIRP